MINNEVNKIESQVIKIILTKEIVGECNEKAFMDIVEEISQMGKDEIETIYPLIDGLFESDMKSLDKNCGCSIQVGIRTKNKPLAQQLADDNLPEEVLLNLTELFSDKTDDDPNAMTAEEFCKRNNIDMDELLKRGVASDSRIKVVNLTNQDDLGSLN